MSFTLFRAAALHRPSLTTVEKGRDVCRLESVRKWFGQGKVAQQRMRLQASLSLAAALVLVRPDPWLKALTTAFEGARVIIGDGSVPIASRDDDGRGAVASLRSAPPGVLRRQRGLEHGERRGGDLCTPFAHDPVLADDTREGHRHSSRSSGR
jgi:hypothetical protein